MNRSIFATLLIATTLVAACGKKEDAATTQPKTEASSAAAAARAVQKTAEAQAGAAQPAAASTVQGTIVETMNASGYTYLKVKTATGEEWAAIPETTVKKGAPISVDVQMVAEKFESKTMKRTFDRIIFGTITGTAPAAAAAPMGQMPPGHPATGAAGAAPMGGTAQEHMKGGAADVGEIKVAKAEGPNGKTVAELWAARASMKDKPVAVRGKVVKFLPGIMGRNWAHLRDGSGSADKGDNDITVTTNDMVNVGDVVLVTGVVRIDKDFGAGYSYQVIIEEGKLAK